MKNRIRKIWPSVLRKPTVTIGVVLLWLLTVFLGIWEIMIVRAMVIRVLIRFFMTREGLSLIMANARADPYGKVTAIVMALLAIGIVVLGFDYHIDNAGKPNSWKLFAWTFVFQFTLLGLAFLL